MLATLAGHLMRSSHVMEDEVEQSAALRTLVLTDTRPQLTADKLS